jgi:hypothetical protein
LGLIGEQGDLPGVDPHDTRDPPGGSASGGDPDHAFVEAREIQFQSAPLARLRGPEHARFGQRRDDVVRHAPEPLGFAGAGAERGQQRVDAAEERVCLGGRGRRLRLS